MRTDDALYAQPWTVGDPEDCFFYHAIEIPGLGLFEGEWDLRGGEESYLGGIELAGQRVLEVGPANGFLTFHMESLGAEVVAVELDPDADWDTVPQANVDLDGWRSQQREAMQGVRRAFWLAHHRFDSAARVHYSSAYDIPAELGRFDVALLGSVCLHLRDPLRAVEACAERSERLVITDRRFPELSGDAVARLVPTAESGECGTWWDLSPELLVRFLGVLGFDDAEVSFHTQRFTSAGQVSDIPMFTIVASRTRPMPDVQRPQSLRRGDGRDAAAPTPADREGDQPLPVDLMPRLVKGEDEGLNALWRSRIELHGQEAYAGVRMSKFPEDLRTYERIIWERAPQVVIEVGVQYGGFTLWLRDRLFDFQRYRTGPAPMVIAADIDLSEARKSFASLPPEGTAGIELIEGDVRDEAVLAAIRGLVPAGAEVLVVEDAQHDAATTLAVLNGLGPLIRANGYYMVEDTCVDLERLRVNDAWPRGALTALEQWLDTDPLGRRFRRRPDLQPYGLTCHPGGLIQRLPDV